MGASQLVRQRLQPTHASCRQLDEAEAAGGVYGIWGLALALPLIAIAKVMIDHFKADDAVPEAMAA